MQVDNSASIPSPTLVLASFVPATFIGLFIFHLVFHRPSLRFLSPPGAALSFSPLRNSETRETEHSFCSPLSSPGASGPNCDSWTSGPEWAEQLERPTLKPSQGADAGFLLTYAPPRWGRTDGKWRGRLEGRGGRRSEGETRIGERESRIQMKKVARKRHCLTWVLGEGGLKEKIS